MHEDFSDQVFERSEANFWVIWALAKWGKIQGHLSTECLVDFCIFLNNVNISASVQSNKVHNPILRIIIWSYLPEYLVKRGAAVVGLMLDSVWTLAGALTGFEFDPVYYQNFRKSLRPTALSTLIRDACAESIGEEPRCFESISEGVHLWLQVQHLGSQ